MIKCQTVTFKYSDGSSHTVHTHEGATPDMLQPAYGRSRVSQPDNMTKAEYLDQNPDAVVLIETIGGSHSWVEPTEMDTTNRSGHRR